MHHRVVSEPWTTERGCSAAGLLSWFLSITNTTCDSSYHAYFFVYSTVNRMRCKNDIFKVPLTLWLSHPAQLLKCSEEQALGQGMEGATAPPLNYGLSETVLVRNLCLNMLNFNRRTPFWEIWVWNWSFEHHYLLCRKYSAVGGKFATSCPAWAYNRIFAYIPSWWCNLQESPANAIRFWNVCRSSKLPKK